LYDKERFKVLDQGNFWYSETPDVPGKGWMLLAVNRICVLGGKFKDKVMERFFNFFQLTFDHQGKVARRESAKLLLERMKAIAQFPRFFVQEILNAAPEDEPIPNHIRRWDVDRLEKGV
jgi:hypothetical protein